MVFQALGDEFHLQLAHRVDDGFLGLKITTYLQGWISRHQLGEQRKNFVFLVFVGGMQGQEDGRLGIFWGRGQDVADLRRDGVVGIERIDLGDGHDVSHRRVVDGRQFLSINRKQVAGFIPYALGAVIPFRIPSEDPAEHVDEGDLSHEGIDVTLENEPDARTFRAELGFECFAGTFLDRLECLTIQRFRNVMDQSV